MATTSEDVWRLLGELAEAQKTTEIQFQETDRQFQETRRLLKEQSQESDRHKHKNREALSTSLSEIPESTDSSCWL